MNPSTDPSRVFSVLGGVKSDPLPSDFSHKLLAHRRAPTSHSDLEAFRQEILESVIRGEIGPVVVLSGGSGSGKSYLCKLLKEVGCSQAERLITRPRRACDPATDRVWMDDGSSGATEIILSYAKHNAHYGVPMSSLKSKAKGDVGPIFIAGDLGKIGPFNRALDLAYPLVPKINIRLDVPVPVMAERLSHHRQEGYLGEAHDRSERNKHLFAWEAAQHRAIKNFFNLHVVMNLTADEHERLGYTESQLRPLDLGLIQNLLPRFQAEAVGRAQILASDIQRARCVENVVGVPAALVEVLDTRIAPQLSAFAVRNFAIKGGLAVAVYVDEENIPELSVDEKAARGLGLASRVVPDGPIGRPVSPDIDWAIGTYEDERDNHLSLIERLSGAPAAFQDYWNKPVFNSNKLNAVVVTDGGERVELDAIALSRVRPAHSPFCFEFPLDEYLAFRRREVRLPSGHSVSLIPPEMVILEKLVAGRDASMGKFDLYDAIAVLATQPIDLEVFHHMVDQQRFREGVDRSLDLAMPNEFMGLSGTLRGAGIRHNELLFSVVSRCVAACKDGDLQGAAPGASSADVATPAIDFSWSHSALKQMAMVDAAISALDACKRALESDEPNEFAPIIVACGRQEVLDRVSQLRDYLFYLAGYQIGRPDIFIADQIFAGVRSE